MAFYHTKACILNKRIYELCGLYLKPKSVASNLLGKIVILISINKTMLMLSAKIKHISRYLCVLSIASQCSVHSLMPIGVTYNCTT